MKYLLPGHESQERVGLMLSLTRIRSEGTIDGIIDHLVKGHDIEIAAALNGLDKSNLKRDIGKVEEVAAKLEKLKEIDGCVKSVK